MPGYVVTAGYVTVETAVPGGRAEVDIPRGTTLPDDVPAEQVQTLLDRADIAPAAPAPAPEPTQPDADPDEVPDGSVADVLAWVGDDPDRAARALTTEQERGDKARTTLVSKLTTITEPQQ